MDNGSRESSSGSRIGYLIAGIGIGTLVGLIFAPQSGEETREYLSQKADEGMEFAKRKAGELRNRAEDLVGRGKEMIDSQKETISQAVDAGRSAFQSEISKSQ